MALHAAKYSALNRFHTHAEESRSDDTPVEWPPEECEEVHPTAANHGADVISEALDSVEPADGDALGESVDEEGKAGTVTIHEWYPVRSSLHK